MKKFVYLFCFTLTIGLFAQDCELPEPYTNGSTGNNLTVLLNSSFFAALNFTSPTVYIVALTSSNLVVGSSCLAPDCLSNGMQSIAVWGDDTFTNEIVEGAVNGETISLKIVDGINLYALNTIIYSTNAIIPISSGIMSYECSGVLEGCTDALACNYNSVANLDDGTCEFPIEYYDCDNHCLNDSDADGTCDELEIIGCIEPMACNYHANATDEGICIYADFTSCESCPGGTDGTGIIVDYDADEDGICDSIGCSDPAAMNYNPFAIEEDGSCEYVHLSELNSLELTAYPNPIIDQMKVLSHKPYSQLQLTITNLIGSLVYHKIFQNIQENDLMEIDLRSLPSGIYMMRASSSSTISSIPLIKK